MGCFNKIGMISSLPIEAGDETTLIFLQKKDSYRKDISGSVYPYDLFSPTFMPIFGEYDDYGKIDNIRDAGTVSFIEKFFNGDIDSIIEMIDNNAVGRGGGKNPKPSKNLEIFDKLTFGLEHTSVYEKLADVSLSSVKKTVRRLGLIEVLSSYGREILFNGFRFPDYSHLKFLADIENKSYADPRQDFIDEIGEKDIMDFIAFNHGVSNLNGKYFPSNYGSQDQDHILHYKMLSLYRNIIVRKFEKYEYSEKQLDELRSEIREEKITDILKRI